MNASSPEGTPRSGSTTYPPGKQRSPAVPWRRPEAGTLANIPARSRYTQFRKGSPHTHPKTAREGFVYHFRELAEGSTPIRLKQALACRFEAKC